MPENLQSTQPKTTRRKNARKKAKPAEIEALRAYTRAEAAQILSCAEITLIRAGANGFLLEHRLGRSVRILGKSLLDWLEAGGKTGHGQQQEGDK